MLLGLLALVKAGGYWLQRFDLTVSTRGFVDGAGYTDVKAQLPAINLLLLISVASFVLFIVNIWRRGWTLPILGRRAVGARRGRGRRDLPAVRAAHQRHARTSPTGSARTSSATSTATREAMGLAEDDIEITPFQLNTDKEPIDLAANADSVRNIRIWDPSPAVLGKTFPQLQRVKDYYRVNDVDVDRYEIDGVRHPGRALRARPQHGRCAPLVVGGPPPHLHARVRRHRRAGQRQGAERRAVLRGPRRPVRHRGRRRSSSRSRRCTSGRTSRATSSWARSSGS